MVAVGSSSSVNDGIYLLFVQKLYNTKMKSLTLFGEHHLKLFGSSNIRRVDRVLLKLNKDNK